MISKILTASLTILLYAMPLQAGQLDQSDRLLLGARPEFRAILVPKNRTTLAAAIAANISQLHGRDGTLFEAGETMVVFDCSMPEAQLKKAFAIQEGAEEKNETIQRLAQLRSVGKLEAKRSANDMAKAQAEVDIWLVRVQQCLIKAPFSGQVAKIHVREHQYVTEGEPIMDILDHRNLEMEIIVPSKWVTWLKPGSVFNIKIDETKKSYLGEVILIGAEVDSLNQSIRVLGKIIGHFVELMSGMSGTVHFERVDSSSSGFQR
jgi:membrane fusion protein, multidrug efflux system